MRHMSFLRVFERAGSVVFLAAIAFEGAYIWPIDLSAWWVMSLVLVVFPSFMWTIASIVAGVVRQNVKRVLWSVGLLALAVPSHFAGTVIGDRIADRIAVAYYGPIIRTAMAAEGKTHSYSYPVDLDGVLASIVYDEIDSDDPDELGRVAWIGDPGCQPNARRIGPHYYLVDKDC